MMKFCVYAVLGLCVQLARVKSGMNDGANARRIASENNKTKDCGFINLVWGTCAGDVKGLKWRGISECDFQK